MRSCAPRALGVRAIMADFVLKFPNFRYCGNKDRAKINFHDTVKLTDPENSIFGARISAISLIQAEL